MVYARGYWKLFGKQYRSDSSHRATDDCLIAFHCVTPQKLTHQCKIFSQKRCLLQVAKVKNLGNFLGTLFLPSADTSLLSILAESALLFPHKPLLEVLSSTGLAFLELPAMLSFPSSDVKNRGKWNGKVRRISDVAAAMKQYIKDLEFSIPCKTSRFFPTPRKKLSPSWFLPEHSIPRVKWNKG